MKASIKANLNQPEVLERLYRSSKTEFKQEFLALYPEIRSHAAAAFWFERLQAEPAPGLNYPRSDLLLVLGLVFLAGVTIVVNGIALAAIVMRIGEWGITPNRLAVLGGNVLMLTHLLLVTRQLYRLAWSEGSSARVEESMAAFLPVYGVWAMLVTFVFPVVFDFG